MSHQVPSGDYDQFGNPIRHGAATTEPYGLSGVGTGGQAQKHHGQQQQHGLGGHQQQHGLGGAAGGLQRSGSSSSSSSEDDGQGGRRKKGMKDKIKEKLPGGHKEDQTRPYGTSTTTPGGGGYVDSSGQHQEKKGMMDKIKEKVPGAHH